MFLYIQAKSIQTAHGRANGLGVALGELAFSAHHPLADLGYNCICFVTSPDYYKGIQGLDLAALNLPSMAEHIANYCRAAGRSAASVST